MYKDPIDKFIRKNIEAIRKKAKVTEFGKSYSKCFYVKKDLKVYIKVIFYNNDDTGILTTKEVEYKDNEGNFYYIYETYIKIFLRQIREELKLDGDFEIGDYIRWGNTNGYVTKAGPKRLALSLRHLCGGVSENDVYVSPKDCQLIHAV